MSDIKNDGKSIRIRLSESQYEELQAFAEKSGLKLGQMVRLALVKIGAINGGEHEREI